jgi:sugar/nucleoside kinase (ribokinase family)
MLAGWGIERCGRFAAAAAALACTRLGAQAGVPTRDAVEALLARGEREG